MVVKQERRARFLDADDAREVLCDLKHKLSSRWSGMPHHLLRVALLTFVGGLLRIAEDEKKCDLAKMATLRIVFGD
jgi:hypothetical protein